MTIRIEALARYPVKGLSPEPLQRVTLTAGDYFPGDRLFAVEDGPSGFDPASPQHFPKMKFLMLMRHESLARLKTRYDDASGVLTITHEGRSIAGDLAAAEGRASVEDFLTGYMGDMRRGPLKILAAPQGYRFTDSPRGFVSLINRASLGALETIAGAAVDPRRMRGNMLLSGLAPWEEFSWLDGVIGIGDSVMLRISKRIQRCAATNVDPDTGLRDLSIPRDLLRTENHADCGVYADILASGAISVGDRVHVLRTGRDGLPF